MIELREQHDLGRAKNAIQDYLIHKLLLPKVYLDADWRGAHVDVLAIDRGGVGDVHAVSIIPPQGRFIEDGAMVKIGRIAFDKMREFKSFLSQYRYVAVVSDDYATRRYEPAEPIIQGSYAADGVGRIGILYVDLSEEEPFIRTILKPERFRSSKQIVELTDSFVAANQANWEVRE